MFDRMARESCGRISFRETIELTVSNEKLFAFHRS